MPLALSSDSSDSSDSSSVSAGSGAPEGGLGLLAALMTSRYGSIGAEVINDTDLEANDRRRQRRRDAVPPPSPPELRRLMGLDPEFRAAVLDARLLGGMVVETGTVDGGRRAAALYCRTSGQGTPQPQFGKLVTIEAPTERELALQVHCVQSYADLRSERVAEIGIQTNNLLSFYGMIDRLDLTRTPLTLELLALALRTGTYAAQAIKIDFDCPRPMEFSSIIQPMLPTPPHSTLPSGHSTQSHLVATVLSRLVEDQPAVSALAGPRFQTAARIAINRTVAGLHFPADSASGAVLGIALGEWIAAMGGEAGEIEVRTFRSGAYVKEHGDFDEDILAALYKDGGGALASDGAQLAPEVDPVLAALWAGARAEWR